MSTQSGKFQTERVQRAIANRINPIRGLTPAVLVSHMEAWRRGDLRRLALLWEEMEQRDWVLQNVVAKRKKAAARCDWEILTSEDSPAAEAQKEFLEALYNDLRVTHVIDQDETGGVRLLLRQMMDAVGKRYSVHEIVWRPGPGTLSADLFFCPLWFFEARTGRLRYLESDAAIDGQPMDPDGWVVTAGDGIMLASAIAYLAKDLGFKDWLNVSEKFGLPIIDAETDAKPGSAEWDTLVEMVESVGQDWAVVHNRGAKLQLLEMKGGTMPQPQLIEYIDRALASLWRGADLSTISAGSGQGQGASLQGQEEQLLLEDDCQMLSETLNRRIDAPALKWRFGEGATPLAYFRVCPPKRQNVDADLKVDEFMLRNGIPVAVTDVLERYSRPMPDDDEDLVEGAKETPADASARGEPGSDTPVGAEGDDGDASEDDPAPGRRVSADMANAAATLRAAFAADLQPIRDRLRAILTIQDPAILESKLRAFREELPKLLVDVNADPAAAREFERIYADRLLEGLADVPRARAG